ncbi:MAG: hypothetical protein K6A73_09900 [Bacteroidales bacterium]|nr:hypothetical protein [Bacteroidales bacterium]
MKKILLAAALVIAMGLGANAQRDSFFNDWEDIGNGLDRTGVEIPTLPGSHGLTDDVTAPLGSGLLVLTALGAGYMVARRRKE